MKKLILIALSMALVNCFFIADTLAAATAITSKVEKQVGSNTRYIITLPSVAVSTTTVFKIPTLKTAGQIDEWHFASLSTDCDIWISGLDAQAATVAPVLYVTGIDLAAGLEIKDRDYVNMDTVQIKFQYLTVKNDDAVNATGASIITLDFIR
jgi:hypothetical protein